MTSPDPTHSAEKDERAADKNALWQLSSDLMLRCTFAGEIKAVNPAWTEILGWSEAELVGSSLFDLVHPEDLQVTQDATKIYSDKGAYRRFDNRYQSMDGGYRWISWSTRIGDNLINAVGRDVTVEKEQALALKDSLEFTQLALSAVGGVGVWTYDPALDLYYCDQAILDLYGLDASKAKLGIPPDRFFSNVHRDDRPRIALVLENSFEGTQDLAIEYRILHPNGLTRWVLSRSHAHYENGCLRRRTGIGVETTAQRQLEDQLRQSQKMEAVGQLTGGLAHDFNNLLTAITGGLELIRARFNQGRPEEATKYITAAEEAAKRAAALTHRLLAFSRRQTLDPKPTDASRLITGMDELLRRTAGPDIRVEIMSEGLLWKTLVDPNQLENAVLNLCINARDAMPDGGKLTVGTRNLTLDEIAAAARELAAGEYVAVSVSDEGTGMPQDVVERAFDPFFTTKPLGQGTGLGLSMIYGFVRQSGGQARIYSQLGKGTTVTAYLPRYFEAPVDVEEQAVAAGLLSARRDQTVLIVDDEPTIRMMIADVLQEIGYKVLEASDGAGGLKMLASDSPADLLVTDVGLPGGMNGRQMADAARVNRPGLKVLFITGFAETAVVRQGQLDTGMHVITKPFDLKELTNKISELLGTDTFGDN